MSGKGVVVSLEMCRQNIVVRLAVIVNLLNTVSGIIRESKVRKITSFVSVLNARKRFR